LLQVEQEEKAAQDAMFHNFFQWKKEMDASDGTKPLMIPLYPPARSCYLLTFKLSYDINLITTTSSHVCL